MPGIRGCSKLSFGISSNSHLTRYSSQSMASSVRKAMIHNLRQEEMPESSTVLITPWQCTLAIRIMILIEVNFPSKSKAREDNLGGLRLPSSPTADSIDSINIKLLHFQHFRKAGSCKHVKVT